MPPSREVLQRGYDAASAYLRRGGYVVVDGTEIIEASRLHFSAMDGDQLVMVDVRVSSSPGGLPSDITKTRRIELGREAKAQAAAMSASTSWRLDLITILVIGIDRALLRHNKDI